MVSIHAAQRAQSPPVGPIKADTDSTIDGPAGATVPRDAAQLLTMSQVALDELYRNVEPGEIPRGRGRGLPIVLPGTPFAVSFGRLAGKVIWRGKLFHDGGQDLHNLLSPFGILGIRATVYRASSWLDGRETIVLDYSKTSRVAGWIRDEIREVAPGLYLGLVFGVGRAFGGARRTSVGFVLTFDG